MNPAQLLGDDPSQKAMMDRLNDVQARDMVKMYNSLVEHCFQSCIEQPKSAKLDEKESNCVNHCTVKFKEASTRMGLRFAEVATDDPNAGKK